MMRSTLTLLGALILLAPAAAQDAAEEYTITPLEPLIKKRGDKWEVTFRMQTIPFNSDSSRRIAWRVTENEPSTMSWTVYASASENTPSCPDASSVTDAAGFESRAR